jgi:hypothetical protein
MKTRHYLSRTWLVVTAALLAGCATPKPVLDLAGQGSATVGLAEISLRDYLALTQAQLTARMDLMRAGTQQEARDQSRRDFDLFLAREAGIRSGDDTAAKIRELGETHRRLREKADEELKALQGKFALDASTLPQVPAVKLAAAKKGFGVLAQELSAQEWLKLAAGYAREIKAGIDSLREPAKPAPAGGD